MTIVKTASEIDAEKLFADALWDSSSVKVKRATAGQQRRHRLFFVINQRQLRHHKCNCIRETARGTGPNGVAECSRSAAVLDTRSAIAQSRTRATLLSPQQVHCAIQNYPGAAGDSVWPVASWPFVHNRRSDVSKRRWKVLLKTAIDNNNEGNDYSRKKTRDERSEVADRFTTKNAARNALAMTFHPQDAYFIVVREKSQGDNCDSRAYTYSQAALEQ